MINIQGVRRNMKNVVKNYSDAQVKVREATSNDPWGPSSTLMSEIADLTYNVVAFSEIMQMIWKRLNDHGKNWRHVYKALVLLEYLIKTGSEKVAQQCRENIFAVQTLKDFQYIEENKDQGMNVREKSKLLVALLKDEEKLKNERIRALKAKERFAQSMSYMGSAGAEGETLPPTSSSYHESLSSSGGDFPFGTDAARAGSELETARPQTLGEEELQLQLALAMSKEEAEQEERLRRNDDLRLQMALNQSEKDGTPVEPKPAIDDLLSLNVANTPVAAPDPWGQTINNNVKSNVFGGNGVISSQTPPKLSKDPWNSQPISSSLASGDPWSTTVQSKPLSDDPWSSSTSLTKTSPMNIGDPWVPINRDDGRSSLTSPDMRMNATGNQSPVNHLYPNIRKTPENFLGPNSNLVNLDALLSSKSSSVLPQGGNPFAPPAASLNNPFQASKPPPPTINQLRAASQFSMSLDSGAVIPNNQQPIAPMQIPGNNGAQFQSISPQQTHNPFAM